MTLRCDVSSFEWCYVVMVSGHGHYIAGNIHEPHGIRQVTGLRGFWVVASLCC